MLTIAIAQLSRWVNPMNIAQRSWVRHRLPFSYNTFFPTEVLCHVFSWRNCNRPTLHIFPHCWSAIPTSCFLFILLLLHLLLVDENLVGSLRTGLLLRTRPAGFSGLFLLSHGRVNAIRTNTLMIKEIERKFLLFILSYGFWEAGS